MNFWRKKNNKLERNTLPHCGGNLMTYKFMSQGYVMSYRVSAPVVFIIEKKNNAFTGVLYFEL